MGFVTWESVDLRLRAARTIWLATTRPDGRPHVVPVWLLWDGSVVHLVTGSRSQKGVNLAARSSAVLHLGDGDDVVILIADAQVVTDPDELADVARRYGDKYVEPVTGQRATPDVVGDQILRLPVSTVTAWSYGNVGSRTDWRLTADEGPTSVSR